MQAIQSYRETASERARDYCGRDSYIRQQSDQMPSEILTDQTEGYVNLLIF